MYRERTTDENPMTDEEIIGDDGDSEKLCVHGVGHSDGVHTCDGCCVKARSLSEKRRKIIQKQSK